MDSREKQELAALREEVSKRLLVTLRGTWLERRAVAAELLARANETWWRVHQLDTSAYERDLHRLNELTGWQGIHAQRATWRSSHGAEVLMPPKFFAGDPLALHDHFIASISLNHAVLSPNSASFAEELQEQQNTLDAFAAHRLYFSKGYAYSKFFRPRGEVLRAYATAVGILSVGAPADWRELNRTLSIYIEAYPTRSPKFVLPPLAPSRAVVETSVFVCAINAVVHDIVIRLLRPRRVLLAGRASWQLWPDSSTSDLGVDVSHLVRPGGACAVFRNFALGSIRGESTTVVRCNFLRTVYGPNSSDELRALGEQVLAHQVKQGIPS